MSLSELMESESALREAESLYQSAVYDYKIAELNLFKASGNLKTLLKGIELRFHYLPISSI